MGREENVTVFMDTERRCKTNPRFSESVKRATAAQKLILEEDILADQKKDIYEEPAKVIVSKKRTYSAAAGYKGHHIAVHNFASASNPGGGVVNGASAQANRNVIKDYLHAFTNIEFAVYCSPRDDRNFKIFERVLKVYSK